MTTLSRITLVSALLALLPTVAPAADKVTRTRMLASDGINAILIQARVGSVRLEPGEGNAIEAKVTLEAKRNSDPVSDLPDVTKVQMSATTRGDQLRLGVDEKKLRLAYVKAIRYNQFHMVVAYYETPSSVPVILDNLIGSIRPATQRRDLVPIYSFNGSHLWLMKARGQGELAGQSSRLGLWNDLRNRMTSGRLARPVVNLDD